ncbi:IgA peptidase M64-domain-containing protein [Naematelia encephala]|uniref:IgA peptidase M64-domain-containing protein n=1 Tax=Naematelia encephala TaxID=71784 RepID=A0A1Y2AMH2_9TREE|nr:IgA peptidase M64-domain-containing protein [Naematelia encephala]
MSIQPLHVSGKGENRVELAFLSDGYVLEERDKFIADAMKLSAELVSENGAMAHVKDLLNTWAVFVPSILSGIGVQNTPLLGNPFGLYRPGPELRAVYIKHPKRARAVCRYWKENKGEGGCDSAIILGNDPLYGGVGGEFTVITASDINGRSILRHELGHTLIPVGDEYDGGEGYCGVNADSVDNVSNLKWQDFLSDPGQTRIEDMQVPLQVYPWHDLDEAPYEVTFFAFNPIDPSIRLYPTAALRLSLSSIPYPSHVRLTINELPVDLTPGYPDAWTASKDRRWVDIPLSDGVPGGPVHVKIELTEVGQLEPAGQGGKMVTSIEIMEFGPQERFNGTAGHVGAYPLFGSDGSLALRPTNDDCLMRITTQSAFCPVCAAGLRTSLQRLIRAKSGQSTGEENWSCKL